MPIPANRVSVIIPVLNEAQTIVPFLDRLQVWRRAGHELVVVDGGSEDKSALLSQPLADKVLVVAPGRARQMNAGAAAGSGDVLLFLHADTTLPLQAPQRLLAALNNPERETQWGWFDVCFSARTVALRVIAFLMNRRARLTRVCTGDQALFVRRSLFNQVQGFPHQPLMEDVALSKLLRRRGRSAVVTDKAETSSRRWEKQGVIRTVLLMWDLRLRYFLGATPESLHARYYPTQQPSKPRPFGAKS